MRTMTDVMYHPPGCMCRDCREEYDDPLTELVQQTEELGGYNNVSVDDAAPEEWDAVNNVKHYQVFEGIEAIDIIKQVLTPQEFKGYCKGNALKYRLRAGKKADVVQDIKKAQRYEDML